VRQILDINNMGSINVPKGLVWLRIDDEPFAEPQGIEVKSNVRKKCY